MSDLNMAIPASGPTASNINSGKVDSKPIIKTEAKAEANDLKTEKLIKPSQEEVEIVIQELNDFMETTKRGLSFSVDKQLGIDLVSVMDLETEEIIRQIPSEELVVLRKKMDDIAGVLFETKV